ncbi:GNAT family N-acetyltransferase [Xanthovirga aplysinae]|uniref:GNAT family N-acetyltransferase n=1 Tax=Xanthovirga aplysinae TaxID=2529853 RepID=UPI0012BD26F4|nr:GNAT family N-acetyltransferase [Xanthovirga aplysinae]MTI31539.1 N-acetyltransferase [Xanthovirga aplysinae]
MNLDISFNTDRLRIRPLTIDDKLFILELVNTTEWIQFIGDRKITTEKEAEIYIQNILEKENIGYWTVQLKENNNRVGIVTFLKKEYLEHPDIGFAFLPNYGKKGYAFEASQAVLESIMENLNLTDVLATTVPENVNSIKLLKRLGLKYQSDLQVDNEKLSVYHISADFLRINKTKDFIELFNKGNK